MNSSTTKKRACLVMLSIVAVLLLAMSTVAPASAARVKVHRPLAGTLEGVWTSEPSTYGDVTFTGPDNDVSGSWVQSDGIKGVIDEGQFGPDTGWLSFKYHAEYPDGTKGPMNGSAILHLDDPNTLVGEWSRKTKEGTTVKGKWTMRRQTKKTQ